MGRVTNGGWPFGVSAFVHTLLEVLHISGRQGNANLVLSNLGGLLKSGLGRLNSIHYFLSKYSPQRQFMSAFSTYSTLLVRQ